MIFASIRAAAFATFIALAATAASVAPPHASQRADTVRVSRAALSLALDSAAFCRPSQSRGVWQTPPRVLQASRVRLLADGSMGMLNVREGKLHLWTSDGREAGVHGRPGGGPGEFGRAIALISWPGDTFAVNDAQLGRISLWNTTGHLRAMSVAGMPHIGHAGAYGSLRDGTIMFTPPVGIPGAERNRPVQLYTTYYSWRDGQPAPATIRDSIRTAEFYVSRNDGRLVQTEVNFGRRTWAAALTNSFAVYDNHGQTIELFDGTGRTTRVIHLGLAELRVSQAERDSLHDVNADLLQRAPFYAEAKRYFPEFRAATRSFESDASGGMWIGVFSPPSRGSGALYIRITEAGVVDRCFRTSGDERVVGVSRDRVAVATSEEESDVIQVWRTAIVN